SKPFRFLVGPKERESTVHSALVEDQSAALDKLINNDKFREATDGYATLPKVNEETFVCFVQFAYTGNYEHSARWILYSTPPRSRAVLEWDSDSDSARSSKDGFWTKFIRLANRLQKRGVYHSGDTLSCNVKVVLQHARLYVLADHYNVSNLVDLTINHLGQALIVFSFCDEETGIIAAWLECCYGVSALGSLKSFVVLYAGFKAKALWKNPDSQDPVGKIGNYRLILSQGDGDGGLRSIGS
ncbi:hypothetical protein N657DRAFT_581455, partial [Parathielavia appendiculata]